MIPMLHKFSARWKSRPSIRRSSGRFARAAWYTNGRWSQGHGASLAEAIPLWRRAIKPPEFRICRSQETSVVSNRWQYSFFLTPEIAASLHVKAVNSPHLEFNTFYTSTPLPEPSAKSSQTHKPADGPRFQSFTFNHIHLGEQISRRVRESHLQTHVERSELTRRITRGWESIEYLTRAPSAPTTLPQSTAAQDLSVSPRMMTRRLKTVADPNGPVERASDPITTRNTAKAQLPSRQDRLPVPSIDQLTEQVIRQIDNKLIAYRERMGTRF
jgi:hypothetical protein